MQMVNMAMKPEEKGKSECCCCCGPCACDEGKPRYPWGLQISLEKEQMDALGMKGMPKVGESMTMSCMVKVTRCSEEEREGGVPMRSMSLQITDMGMDEKRNQVDMSAILPKTSKGAM